MLWFSGDKHLGHAKVLELSKRRFPNIHVHDQTIIANHNEVVGEKDDYWDLGDIGFRCTPEYIAGCLRQLNGRLHIILGNHDKPLRQAIKRGLVKDMLDNGKLEVIGHVNSSVLASKVVNRLKKLGMNVPAGLFHEIRKDMANYTYQCTPINPTVIVGKTIRMQGQDVILSHYAYRSWHKAFRDSWHLYAHSHNNLSSFFKSIDVGVDANNYFPISELEVKKKMDKLTEQFRED